MKKIIAFFAVICLISCAKKVATSGPATAKEGKGDTRTKDVLMIDNNTYLLINATDDETYGYTQSNPVEVGGSGESSGPLNERRFLNGLAGPNGENIRYFRAGSVALLKHPMGFSTVVAC